MQHKVFSSTLDIIPELLETAVDNLWTYPGLMTILGLGSLALFLTERFRRFVLSQKLEDARFALESSPESWITLVQNINQTFRISGYSNNTEDLLGLRLSPPFPNSVILSVLNDLDRKTLTQGITNCFKNSHPFHYDFENIKTQRWIQVRGQFNEGEIPQVVLWLKEFIPQQKIDEQTQKIAVLKNRLTRLETLLDTLPIPVWSRDSDLDLIYCNQAYGHAANTTPSEAIEKNIEIGSAAFNKSHRDLAAWALETQHRQTDKRSVVIHGDRRFWDFSEIPIDGQELVGFALDVTAIHEAQTDLARHMSSHGEVLSLLSTAVAIYSPDARLQFFNKRYQQLFGGTDDSWMSRNPSLGEVIDRLRENRLIEEKLDYGRYKQEELDKFTSLVSPVEELQHLPDGRTIRMVRAPHPLGGLIYLFEDVTDRLTLERNFNTLSAIQRGTIDHLYEGIAVFSNSGRLTLSNPSFWKIWRVQPHDIKDQHISNLLEQVRPLIAHKLSWEEHKKLLINKITNRVAKSKLMERTDGSILKISYIPLPDGSHLVTYLDVTDSIHVERVLREKNEALEAADHIKSEFISNVSYQLRAPLNTVIGFSEILLHQFYGKINDKQREYCDGILGCSKQLLSHINDILDLASIQAGRMELSKTAFNFNDLLKHTLDLVRQKAMESKLTISLEYGPENHLCYGDHTRLKQVLFNLLNNAIQFTQEGGVINLSIARHLDMICVIVSDSGSGLSAFQAQTSPSESHSQEILSNSFGLPLIRSLVELHGGTLDLYAHDGVGSTVLCQLPIALESSPLSNMLTGT